MKNNYYAGIVKSGMHKVGVLFFCILLVYGCSVARNDFSDQGIKITLPQTLRNAKMEFSSMAWDGSRLLLVPQFPDTFQNEIYALNRDDIEQAVENKTEITSYDVIKVTGLQSVKKYIGPDYEGIEATVIENGRIFFSIETNAVNANCYLVAGNLQGNIIALDAQKIMALPKLKRLSNAGFESMAWLSGLQRLILFFEYNKQDIGSKAMLVDTSFLKKPDTLHFDPLMYRLTDVTAVSGRKMLGINYHYNRSKTEYAEYIGRDSSFVDPEMGGKTLKQSPFSRVIEISAGRAVTWRSLRSLSLSGENFEGIAPFKNGVLLITDEFPGSLLKWYRLR